MGELLVWHQVLPLFRPSDLLTTSVPYYTCFLWTWGHIGVLPNKLVWPPQCLSDRVQDVSCLCLAYRVSLHPPDIWASFSALECVCVCTRTEAHVECPCPYLSCMLWNGKHRYQLISSSPLTVDELTVGKYTGFKGPHESVSQSRKRTIVLCHVMCLFSYLVLPSLAGVNMLEL